MQKEIISEIPDMSTFTIDLTATRACNFGCSYCFEKGQFKNEDVTLETIDKIIDFMKTNNFIYNIMIMGGEPTISKNLKVFFEKLKIEIEKGNIYLQKISAGGNSVYITNGYKLNFYNQFQDINFWKEYFNIQISYDGRVIQDKYRKTLKGKLTSDIVLQSIDTVSKDFKFSVKSTIDINDLIHIEEILNEFKELNKKYKINYNPTETKESISNFFMNEEKIKKIIDEAFPKIIKFEENFYKENGYFLTKWLNESNLKKNILCSAGISMIGVNPNGTTNSCHLVNYINNKDKNILEYGVINDPQTLTNFKKVKHHIENSKEDKCKDCTAVYCLKCPVHKFNIDSNIDEVYNGIDDKICFYYKEISKYLYFLLKKLNKI